MCEFNLRNYWCQKLCAGGGGFKSGGLPGLQTACIYRSQELRSEIGSMLQVLFRFQLQPILINWLLSSPAKWGSALINGHTQTGSHSQKHTDTLSLFRFFCITACDQHTQTHIHTHTHACTDAKPSKCVWSMPTRPESRICIISRSVVLIDRRIKWLVKESLMWLLFSFLFAQSQILEFLRKERSLPLDVCSCDLGFDLETCNRCLFKEPADSSCML